MALKERIEADLKTAMKERAAEKLSVIRMLKSAVKYREIEVMKPLEDPEVLAVIATEMKRRRDSVEQYRAGGREDLASKEEREIAVLQGYLPQQLSPVELDEMVAAAIVATGAKGPKDMGAVMKALLPQVQARAEGKAVSDAVKRQLAGLAG